MRSLRSTEPAIRLIWVVCYSATLQFSKLEVLSNLPVSRNQETLL